MSCTDNRENCGTQVPTSCSPYTGDDLPGITLPEDPNANDVFKELAERLDDFIKSFDTSKVIPGSLPIDPNKSKGYEILNSIIVALKAVQDAQKNCKITQDLTVHLNLEGLIPSGSYCYSEDDQYTIQAVLGIFLTEILKLKSKLANVQGSSTIPVYVPNY